MRLVFLAQVDLSASHLTCKYFCKLFAAAVVTFSTNVAHSQSYLDPSSEQRREQQRIQA